MSPSAVCAAFRPAYGAGNVATKVDEVSREPASAVYKPTLPSTAAWELLI